MIDLIDLDLDLDLILIHLIRSLSADAPATTVFVDKSNLRNCNEDGTVEPEMKLFL